MPDIPYSDPKSSNILTKTNKKKIRTILQSESNDEAHLSNSQINPIAYDPELEVNSGNIDIYTHQNLTVIGELHVRMREGDQETAFLKLLNEADIVIVEFDSDVSSPDGTLIYNEVSEYPRYMKIAQEHAVESGKPLIIMDQFQMPRLQRLMWAGFSEEEAIVICSYFTGLLADGLKLNVDEKMNELINKVDPEGKKYQFIKTAVKQALTGESLIVGEKTVGINQVIALYDKLNTTIRNLEYSNITQKIIEANPGKKILEVCGKHHADKVFFDVVESRLGIERLDQESLKLLKEYTQEVIKKYKH
jgi:hypothetical protein